MHFGVILPNYGLDSNPDGIRRTAELAEELGFDSVWATEHIIVGPEGVDPYGRVYAPLVTLGWIAGFTQRIALGTSIVLAPLHHPMHLAKEVATLQELSGGRAMLGVGMGWHKDEYDFIGRPVRGPRASRGRGDPGDAGALERREGLRGADLVVPRRDVGAAPVAAPGDLGRRQLRACDPPCAAVGRRVASVARLGRRPCAAREGAASGVARDPADGGGGRRRDARRGAEGAVVQFAGEPAMREFAERFSSA